MKQLCELDEWKYVCWESSTTAKKKSPVPSHFFTKSPVAILTNPWEFGTGNVHTQAVEDRAMCFYFYPTSLDVHRYVSEWFWDQEIYDFIAGYLPHFERLTCRIYKKAYDTKSAGDDWHKFILGHLADPESTHTKLIQLLQDKTLPSNNARALKFVELGYGSRATFYRHLKDVEERMGLEDVTAIKVKGDTPAPTPDPMLLDPIEELEEEEEDGE